MLLASVKEESEKEVCVGTICFSGLGTCYRLS